MAKQKFYVVWEGVTPGVYTSWTDCQLQIKGYEAAKYKSFDTREEAERALTMSPYAYIGKNAKAKSGGPKPSSDTLPSCVIDNSLAVDAACSGNPGPMEYRGVHSDSANAISWVRQKKCKTKLPRTPETEELFLLIERAEKWLQGNTYTTRILKWETKEWGEIPADFGRK